MKNILVNNLLPPRDTFIERKPGESANDRNDRAIREAGIWYNKHLANCGTQKIKVILISDDADNLAKAKEIGLISSSSNYI